MVDAFQLAGRAARAGLRDSAHASAVRHARSAPERPGALHAAALARGEHVPPGFRTDQDGRLQVLHLRDPQGNNGALPCSDPDEPRRPR